MKRVDGRLPDALRDFKITPNVLRHAEGSAMIEIGETKVLCSATVQEGVPGFMKGKGKGWLTAEYAMLPRCSAQRITRDSARGKVNGRSSEIQRLIGRTLRTVFRLQKFGERTMIIDCDVIEADGGTRCASITGAFVALALAVEKLREQQKVSQKVCLIEDFLAAVSVGIVEERPVLDLCYLEDAQAQTDMNIAMTGAGKFIELQGTAEQDPFSRDELNQLLELGEIGCKQLIDLQKEVLGIDTFKIEPTGR